MTLIPPGSEKNLSSPSEETAVTIWQSKFYDHNAEAEDEGEIHLDCLEDNQDMNCGTNGKLWISNKA